MPNSYRLVDADAGLSQGDIFEGIPIPDLSFDPMYEVILDGDGCHVFEVADDKLANHMLVIAKIELTSAIIVSQSCDAEKSPRIMLAPLTPFTPAGGSDDKQWKDIRNVATDIVGALYLPDDPAFGFPRRLAVLGQAFALPSAALRAFASRGKRKATLSVGLLSHLQYRLGVMYSRQAREEVEWASVADLGLYLASVDKQVTAREGDLKGKSRKLESFPPDGRLDDLVKLKAGIQAAEEDLLRLGDERRRILSALDAAKQEVASRPPPQADQHATTAPPHIVSGEGAAIVTAMADTSAATTGDAELAQSDDAPAK